MKETPLQSIVIDVREPIEFKDKNLPGAVNIPSTQYDKSLFEQYRSFKLFLVCESGNRARNVQTKLINDGFENVELLDVQMCQFSCQESTNGWTVDRQFRLVLGVLLATFLLLYFLNVKGGVVIPIVLSTGLIFTSLIDKCYMRMGIAMLPWNKNKKS